MSVGTIRVREVKTHDRHIEILYGAGDYSFATKIFYHDVSFSQLKKLYSAQTVETVVAHIALFEGMKLCSLFPKTFDISAIAPYLLPQSLDLFYKIYSGVFAQHCYENRVNDYFGPEVVPNRDRLQVRQPDKIVGENDIILTGCGGGKDSAVMLKLMESASLPFASMQYSHTVYGKADFQHQLIDGVVKTVSPNATHQVSIYDDFADYPLFELYFPENSGIIAPETPVSIFESLPLMMQYGYRYFGLAHEKSANKGNLFSEFLGKEVNHQWGKGYEAETLLNTFIRDYLLSNFNYFSLLAPIYDIRIFKLLSKYPELLPKIHSCNIRKPWCKKCPKCAYVWLGTMAFCDRDRVDAVFQKNLFDDADLLPTFRQMMGLESQTPFECIGEIEETRLMLKRCREKGLQGKAIAVFEKEVLSQDIDWNALEQQYDRVYSQEHAIPQEIFKAIESLL